MEASLYVERSAGLTRRVLLDRDGHAFRIDLAAPVLESQPAVGEIWAAKLGPRIGPQDWAVDFGDGLRGAIRRPRTLTASLGTLLAVEIVSESHADKGPSARLRKDIALDGRTAPGRISEPSTDPFLAGVSVIETIEDRNAAAVCDEAFEAAIAERIALPTGGAVWIERTHALTAIDVDSAGLPSRENLRGLNARAAQTLVRHLALRGTGGLCVIDFAGAVREPERPELLGLLRRELPALTARPCDIMGISRFGLCELTIARTTRSLQDALDLLTPAGLMGLEALRRIERAHETEPRRRVLTEAPEAALQWLETSLPDWKNLLADRIGVNWRLDPAGDCATTVGVRSER